MHSLKRIVPVAEWSGFWPRFCVKLCAALTLCGGASVLVAQAPPAMPAFAAKVEEDPNTGYKRLVPLAAYYGDAKAKGAHNKLFADKVRPVLAGQRPFAEGRRDLENYYNLIYFPILTQPSDEALRLLSDERVRFMRDHLEQSGSKSPEAFATLNGLTLNVMTGIVQDNFHPAVRYNAMLIVSSLNDTPATRTAGKEVPGVPMQRALKVIFDEFKRPENPDAVRMAALLGLTWHLEAEVLKPANAPPAAWKASVVDELLKFATTQETPEGRSTDGHTWMRRRAVDALAIACQSKGDEKVATALQAIIRDDEEPLSLRTTAALAFGKMSLQGLSIDVPALAKDLGYVALVACETELTRAITQRKDEVERLSRLSGTYSGEGGGYGGGYGGDGGMGLSGMTGMPGMPGMGGMGGYGGSADGLGGTGYQGPRPMGGMTGTMPGGGLSGDGGYGGEMAPPDPSTLDPKHYRFDLIRRRMRADLFSVQMGLLGGEDRLRPKTVGGAQVAKAAAKDASQAAPTEKRGLQSIAKPNELPIVNNVYWDVRDLVDMIENRATDTFQLDREMRKRMAKLEAQVGKRTPAVGPGIVDEDLPGAVSAIAPGKAAGKGGAKAAAPGKGPPKAPTGKAPVPAAKAVPSPQKAAWKAPPAAPKFRPQNVVGSVRR